MAVNEIQIPKPRKKMDPAGWLVICLLAGAFAVAGDHNGIMIFPAAFAVFAGYRAYKGFKESKRPIEN